MKRGVITEFSEDEQGTIWYKKCFVVPNGKELKELILKESHESPYIIHPGSMKMYKDLKQRFRWYGMTREMVRFVCTCDMCQRVKAEHQ